MNIQTSTIVRMSENLTLMSSDGSYDLNINITADFKDIPVEYHEVFLNMLSAKYLNKVSFGHNPFSQCEPPKVKKFWGRFFSKLFNKN